MARYGFVDDVSVDRLRAVARKILDDESYLDEIREIARQTEGDAAGELNKDKDDSEVRQLAEEMVIGRLLGSAGGGLSLDSMKNARGCDCCKWEAAIAGQDL